MIHSNKLVRFLWRSSRNALCLTPLTRGMVFPQDRLAARFGRADADYAWNVFRHHSRMLLDAGFVSAGRVLEVGPGRNLGTALLWWVYFEARRGAPVEIVCWDVFRNASPQDADFWSGLARELLDVRVDWATRHDLDLNQLQVLLREVADGTLSPRIHYRVESMRQLQNAIMDEQHKFDLVYSQAAIEHIWHVEAFWDTIVRLTRLGGWHSHRIDLADHGRRETNYIEMLEWSDTGYWLTMRFVPGAVNRWRAQQYLNKLESMGMRIRSAEREMRDQLPIQRRSLAPAFRELKDEELRTTALDVVAVLAEDPQ